MTPEDIANLDPPEGVGTQIAVMISWAFKRPGCPRCIALAEEWNRWGPQTCRERIDEIVSDLLDRAEQEGAVAHWAAKLAPLTALVSHCIVVVERRPEGWRRESLETLTVLPREKCGCGRPS